MTNANTFPALLQAFFTDRLLLQRMVSDHTIASYRDSFRLFLNFAASRLNKIPSKLTFQDLDTSFITDFLEYIEKERGNSARTRNVRLAAIHSFFRYVSFCEPTCIDLCCRILAIPSKRYERRPIVFLVKSEIEALLCAPDTTTCIGRRDHAFLLLASQTGMRVSELTKLRCKDVTLKTGAHVKCFGKGRKQRCTPLRKETITVLKAWLRERNGSPEDPVFPTIRGNTMSRDAIERLVTKHHKTAAQQCPSLKQKKSISPHVLRHSAAMALLHAGVDRTVIALWLGHESVETTQIYIHADMQLKEKALSHTTPFKANPGRFQPDDELMMFLDSL